jgi:hypothetical protein
MTFEEKVEFLMQSIASHDRQLGELTDSVRANDRHIEAMGEHVKRLAEVTQVNFDRLTRAMTGLTDIVADHERRIGKIENRHP